MALNWPPLDGNWPIAPPANRQVVRYVRKLSHADTALPRAATVRTLPDFVWLIRINRLKTELCGPKFAILMPNR